MATITDCICDGYSNTHARCTMLINSTNYDLLYAMGTDRNCQSGDAARLPVPLAVGYADRTTTQACDLAFRLLQIARAWLFVTPKACRR
jgi:hypothetical protein